MYGVLIDLYCCRCFYIFQYIAKCSDDHRDQWCSLGSATSIITAIFSSLSTTTISVWLAIHCFFSVYLKSYRILLWSFCNIFGGVSHFDLGVYSPDVVQVFLHTIPATWVWHSMYVLPASILDLAWCGRSQLHSLLCRWVGGACLSLW